MTFPYLRTAILSVTFWLPSLLSHVPFPFPWYPSWVYFCVPVISLDLKWERNKGDTFYSETGLFHLVWIYISIHFLANGRICLFFVAEESPIVYVHCILVVHSSTDGHPHWLHKQAVIRRATIKVDVLVSLEWAESDCFLVYTWKWYGWFTQMIFAILLAIVFLNFSDQDHLLILFANKSKLLMTSQPKPSARKFW